MARQYVCWYCKNKIVDEEPVLYETGSLKKRFHKKCFDAYRPRTVERHEWDDVYKYLQDILHTDKPLSKTQCNLVFSLKTGELVVSNSKVALNNKGYPYNVILLTLKAKRSDIDRALQNKSFANELQKTKYIMAIVAGSINDIYNRWKEAEKQKEKLPQKLEAIDITVTEQEYIKTEKKSNDLDDLW